MSTLTPDTARPALYPSRRLLNVTEIGQILGTDRMARRLISERRLPVVKIGRLARVWSDDLDAYLEANTRPANGPTR